MSELHDALDSAHRLALEWLDSLPDRTVPARASAAEVMAALGELPDGPRPAAEVIELLGTAAEPGLTAIPGGRWYGMVMGGTMPAALAADWLVSAWDQNNALRAVTPATVALEDLADRWLLDLLGLPPECGVGMPTGGTMSNFTCLVTARDTVLRRAGWDVAKRGLVGCPGIRVLVGAERHDSIDKVLRLMGLGEPEAVEADEQGRIRVDALADALSQGRGVPTVVALQAGNVHSGSFDDFSAAIPLAHAAGAWVHVDGAFGLFAAASPRLRHLTAGFEAADSWATDAHKTLNVPYDCGIAIVRDVAAMRGSLGMHGDYLIQDSAGEPFDRVPEMSRRARATTVWAALASMGRSGVAELVERFCAHATMFAEGLARIPDVEVLNEVVFTQVCASFGSDERTQRVVQRMLADGTAWTTGSRWHDQAVLRVALCNWSTTDSDVRTTLEALQRAAA